MCRSLGVAPLYPLPLVKYHLDSTFDYPDNSSLHGAVDCDIVLAISIRTYRDIQQRRNIHRPLPATRPGLLRRLASQPSSLVVYATYSKFLFPEGALDLSCCPISLSCWACPSPRPSTRCRSPAANIVTSSTSVASAPLVTSVSCKLYQVIVAPSLIDGAPSTSCYSVSVSCSSLPLLQAPGALPGAS